MSYRVNESEYRFLTILWDKEPISSPELVGECLEHLGWKKSTTYTVIKRLSEKHIVESNASIVKALVLKEQIDLQESTAFLEKNFNGNVPAFFATFLRGKKLTKEEVANIMKMIEEASDDE